MPRNVNRPRWRSRARAVAAAWSSSRPSNAPANRARRPSLGPIAHDDRSLDTHQRRLPMPPILDRRRSPLAPSRIAAPSRAPFSHPRNSNAPSPRAPSRAPSDSSHRTSDKHADPTTAGATIPIANGATETRRPAVSSPEASRTPAVRASQTVSSRQASENP